LQAKSTIKEPHRFDISHYGFDPSLPTHSVSAKNRGGGRNWWWFIVIIIALIAIGYLIRYIIEAL
jgi:hypothetical protein